MPVAGTAAGGHGCRCDLDASRFPCRHCLLFSVATWRQKLAERRIVLGTPGGGRTLVGYDYEYGVDGRLFLAQTTRAWLGAAVPRAGCVCRAANIALTNPTASVLDLASKLSTLRRVEMSSLQNASCRPFLVLRGMNRLESIEVSGPICSTTCRCCR